MKNSEVMLCILAAGVGAMFGAVVVERITAARVHEATITHACGECDHVGECGDYECRPGVDGWQLKAGAR